VNKFFLYLFIIILLSNCGTVKKEDVNKNINTKIIFEKSKPIKEELNPDLIIKINKLTKGEPFLRNNTNNVGNINFETNFNKILHYKFSAIKEFEFSQPELIFTNDENIIFFDGKGSIFKVNKELKELWKVNHYTKKEKKLNPILYFAQTNKNLIIADSLSKIYLIDLKNGNLIWSKDSNASFNSNIKVIKDKFLVLDFENTIRCFSIKNGNEIWNYETENPFIKSQKKLSLVTKGNYVYFVNNIGDITALDTDNGSLYWQTPTQSNVIYQDAFSLENSDLVFANNSIYFSNNKNQFFSIDANSGIIKWKQRINSSILPTIIDKLVFSVSNEGYIFVIDDEKGNVIRITNALKNIENKKQLIKPTGFIIARNKIYLSLNNGRLIKINATTGKEEKIIKLNKSKLLRPNVFQGSMYLLKDNAIIKTD